jgi:hypothetical protein
MRDMALRQPMLSLGRGKGYNEIYSDWVYDRDGGFCLNVVVSYHLRCTGNLVTTVSSTRVKTSRRSNE